MNDGWTDRISEYLDGDLAEPERSAFEAHLDGCEGCQRVRDELARVVGRARALDDRPPTQDLWPTIAHRIGASVPRQRRRAPDGVLRMWRRRVVVTVPQLLAAGLATLVFAGVGGTLVSRSTGTSSGNEPLPLPTVGPGLEASVTTPAIQRYRDAVADLLEVYERDRDRLRPSTIAVLDENLAVIDRAIRQSEDALAADPESEYLRSHVAQTLEQKLELLQRLTAMVSAS